MRITRWLSLALVLVLLISLMACSGGGAPSPTAPAKTTAPTASPKATTTTAPTPTTAAPKVTASPSPAALSFAGKTITLVVGVAAGGGVDTMARVYSKFLTKYLPGNPSMIVKDMPGGGGTIGPNYVYTSKPDGMTVFVSSGSPLMAQVLGLSTVKYDLLKMPSVLNIVEGSIVITKKGVISKPEDIVKGKGLIYGHSPGALGNCFVTIKELLGIPMDKTILAFSGSGDARRAFLAGETNMTSETGVGYAEAHTQLVAKGEVIPVLQTGFVDASGNLLKDPGFPADILTAKELYEKIYGKPPSGMPWDAMKAVLGAAGTQKGLFLPPGTPDNIVRAYWTACEQMLKDPEFRKIADAFQGADAMWLVGETSDKTFKQTYGMKPEIRDWVKGRLAAIGVAVG